MSDTITITTLMQTAAQLDQPPVTLTGGMLHSTEFGLSWGDLVHTRGQELMIRAFPPLVAAVRNASQNTAGSIQETLATLGFDTDTLNDTTNDIPASLPLAAGGPLDTLSIFVKNIYGHDISDLLHPQRIIQLSVVDGEITSTSVHLAQFNDHDGRERYRGIIT